LVAKIARTLARFFRLNEDLVEAIALGHDIGHAPFGHAGESCIAKVLEENNAGSFVHNAQSVRILESIENGGNGLNLTLQVLDGILGHNGEFWEASVSSATSPLSWAALDANVEKCLTRPRSEKPDKEVFPSTFEGCVVRVSDVIAYVGRDIQDAIALKLIRDDDLPRDAITVIGASNREIINNLTMDLTHNTTTCDGLQFSDRAFKAMKTLLEFNQRRIYQSAVIVEQRRRFERIVRELFETYLDDIRTGDERSAVYMHHLSLLDASYRENNSNYRIVADFIAGMTDRFLLGQYLQRFMPEKIGYRVVS
jgi:dGTPase